MALKFVKYKIKVFIRLCISVLPGKDNNETVHAE